MKKSHIKGFLIIFLWCVGQFFSSVAVAQPDGAALFQANCAQCHGVGKGDLVGPDLMNVHKRRPEDWLIKWIRNSTAMIKSGDAYAVEIYNKYNKVQMPNQNLTDDEIKAVLAYVKTESEKAPAAAPSAAVASGQEGQEEDSGSTTLILILSSIVLLVLASVLSKIKNTLKKVVREKEGLPEPVIIPVKQQAKYWILNNKKAVALMLLGLTAIGLYKGWYALSAIGVNEGYQPDQPIAFSHKIHAGENGINCQYCHTGVEKSKVASLPTAGTCMNCHKYIKQGPNTGTEEIAKIYKTLDYDPSTMKYGPNQKPIVWTRVHNLPDLAYFNHAQHVKVGKIECKSCHGNIEEQTVAAQNAPLTMGWCIDCHRNTKVQMEGNPYYADLHKKLSEKFKGKEIKVADIGGLECARCHY